MKKKVCTIGGGTGNFVVLSGLKKYNINLSAIVAMADNGGSSGILRDELGVLPAGDVRQCIVALSNSSRLMRNLMNHRFEDPGFLQGHSFGNLFLSTLERETGSFEKAIEELGFILNIKGKVIPVTTSKTHLEMVLKGGERLIGEEEIYLSDKIDKGYEKIFLNPFPKVNSRAIDEIMNSDVVVLGPGGLYTSLISSLLVDGVVDALKKTQAIKVFVVNLMNKKGQTTGFKTSDYLAEIEKYTGANIFDIILVNNEIPDEDLMKFYEAEGDLVENDLTSNPKVIEKKLLGKRVMPKKGDLIKRNLIRHDMDKLAVEIMNIMEYGKMESINLSDIRGEDGRNSICN
jgi:uncharacterized cofD-like protein